jgi:hypothetical protein
MQKKTAAVMKGLRRKKSYKITLHMKVTSIMSDSKCIAIS